MATTDKVVQDAFRILVRRALKTGEDEPFPNLDEFQWEAVLNIGKIQGVTGLLFSGADSLPDEILVPDSIAFRLMVEADRIIRRSEQVSKAESSLINKLRKNGFHPIILKGPAVAAYYPDPSLRESGDLDIFLPPGEFEAAIEALSIKDFHKDPDGNLVYTWEGVMIDQHPRYFDLHSHKCADIKADNSPEAQLLMLSLHIRKHCMGAGVGLRQICDMAMAYKHFDGNYDHQSLLDLYERTGSGKWNRLLASFIKEYLGKVPLPYPVDSPLPNPSTLHSIVFAGGSFGHYDPSRGTALKKGGTARKFDSFLRILRRVPFSLIYAPRELLPYMTSLIRGNISSHS